MLNANNKVNYETSIKQKEKKYSLSTVLAWLYLKTIGQILPGRWNKWAENTLYYKKIIADNGVQTDDLLNSNREKELKDENERLKEKLKEGSKKEENQSNLNQELTKKEKEITELKEQVKLSGKEKEVFAKFFASQAQQIGNLQLENKELKSKLAELKKSYKELAEVAEKKGEEFLAQLKEKSEKILDLNKELINLSTKFANEKEKGLVEIEEKDVKIGSLMKLNKVLEQEKKEMDDENNAQQRTISDQDKRIKEQDTLITSLTDKNKDINETVKKENESLRAQNTKLESKVSKLKKESGTQIKQLESQLEEKQAELEQAKKKNTEVEDLTRELESTQQQLGQEKTNLNTIEKKKQDLESEINELKEQAKGKDAEVENLKQQLEQEKINLNTIEKEKEELESEVDKLQEKSQKLEESNVEIKKQKADLEKKLEFSQGENKKLQEQVEHLSAEQEKAKSVAVSIMDSTKILKIESSIAEGRQQKLKDEQKDAGKKPEGMNKNTKALDAKSRLSTAKSITKSTFSKVQNKLLGNEDLNNFLSKKNEELKKGFPEFKGEHFCHNVLKKTIQSLSNQSDGKFESNKLLALLKENLVQSGRAIIETNVNKVVTEVGKKHSIKNGDFVKNCVNKLYLNEEDNKAILNSFKEFLAQGSVSNNDSVKKFVVQKLTEAQIKCFSDKVQQLASSIRDKFLSPDQGMCNQTQGGVNEYQLTDKAKKEYKLTPNSSMRHTTSSNIQRVTRVGS